MRNTSEEGCLRPRAAFENGHGGKGSSKNKVTADVLAQQAPVGGGKGGPKQTRKAKRGLEVRRERPLHGEGKRKSGSGFTQEGQLPLSPPVPKGGRRGAGSST